MHEGTSTQGRRDEALAPSRQATIEEQGSEISDRPRRRRPRMPGFDYAGSYAYHVAVIVHDRRPVLTGDNAEAVVGDLYRAAQATSFELLTYCVMPDHMHALVLGVDGHANLLKFIQRFKQLTSFRFSKSHPKPFWQQSFYDHALRHNEDVLPIAKYILGNPVEAGLVTSGEEWPYSGGTLLANDDAHQEHDPQDGAKASSLHPPDPTPPVRTTGDTP